MSKTVRDDGMYECMRMGIGSCFCLWDFKKDSQISIGIHGILHGVPTEYYCTWRI